MRDLRVKLVLNPVGQGLFYNGVIGSFQFVYDCGSRPKADVEPAVIEYKQLLNGRKLNFLTISHFDDDHISGLDTLLDDLNVDYVFIPYLRPIERLVHALKNSALDDWYYQFLSNPISYLYEKVNKVVIIGRGSDKPPNDTNRKDEFNFNPEQSGFDDEVLRMPDDKETRNMILEEEPDLNSYMDKLNVKSHCWRLLIWNIWGFKFFNHTQPEPNLDNFRDYLTQNFDGDLSNKWIQDAIKNPELRAKIKAGYTDNFENLNSTSLAMYHGPIKNNCFYSWMEVHDLRFPSIPKPKPWHWIPRPSYRLPNPRAGYLLTGDINLNPKPAWNDFRRCFTADFNYMTGILMPHHGSKNNWNQQILGKLKRPSIFYVSAGLENSYGHPDSEVVKNIIQLGHFIVWSNQQSTIIERGCLFLNVK